jgi:hypothetical protein
MGVAAFQFGNFTAAPISVVQSNSVYIAVSPDDLAPDGVHIAQGWDASIFIDGNDNVIGALGTETFDPPDVLTTVDARIVNTIDLTLMQAGDNSTAVAEVNSLIGQQTTGDQAVIEAYVSGATTIADSTLNITDGFGWGRWTSGTLLAFDATPGTEVNTLTGEQSTHFIFGQAPLGPIATSGNATYTFVGGTRSTSASGSTIGTGVTTGSIGVDFGRGNGTIGMNVDHAGTVYNVSGSMNVLPADGVIFDNIVTAMTTSGNCNTGCQTFIDGGFAGPDSSTTGIPKYIGIEYDIQDIDVVMGVAGFSTP